MRDLRLAVIGTGHLGKIHARLAKNVPGIKLVAVVDPDTKACAAVATENLVKACSSHTEIMHEIDAAIVATPTRYHREVAAELLTNDIHVLVEKPITLTASDADHLNALAGRKSLVLQVGHVERFNPVFAHVAGTIESPRYIEATRASGYTFRSTDVGVVLDLMIHDIDLVLSLVQSSVAEVAATGFTAFGPHEDMVQARLTFENGCVANLTASRVSYAPRRDMQIFAANGHFNLDFTTRNLKSISPVPAVVSSSWDPHHISDAQKESIKEHLFESYLPLQEVELQQCNAIEEEIKDFAHCIRHGGTPRVTGQAGRDAVAVAQQVIQAVESHYWTDQDQVLRGPRMTPEPKVISISQPVATTKHRKAG
ncbi:MAG: oxidoreductase [Blastopirellula sp.]|nr:MAG: oxidoreductase [Blastopirellula sp.]